MDNINWRMTGAIVLPNVGGWLGSLIVRKNIPTWYKDLKRPSWNPPNYIFGPAWTSLYCSMGYASYLVYRDGGGFSGDAAAPLAIYGTNLLLNWIWTPIFFGAHEIRLAFYEILGVWATTVAVGIGFFRVNNVAGYLIAPYLAWTTFATCLNYAIMKRNEEEKPKDN